MDLFTKPVVNNPTAVTARSFICSQIDCEHMNNLAVEEENLKKKYNPI